PAIWRMRPQQSHAPFSVVATTCSVLPAPFAADSGRMTRTNAAAESAMLSSSTISPPAPSPPPERPGFFLGLAQRHPFWAFFAIVIFSNVFSTVFNFLYNIYLIVEGILDAEQKAVFWNVASPAYNMVAYP